MDKTPCDASQLLEELARAEDPEGIYRKLHDCFYRRLFAYFRRQGFPPEESEDLVQETFLRVFRKLHEFRRQSRFETWVYGIAANVKKNRIRDREAGKRKMHEVSIETGNEGDGGEISIRSDERDALENLLSKEEKQLVADEVGAMPPRMRQSFRMYCENFKFREIAVSLQVKTNTVKSQIAQAKHRIREALADYRSNKGESDEVKP